MDSRLWYGKRPGLGHKAFKEIVGVGLPSKPIRQHSESLGKGSGGGGGGDATGSVIGPQAPLSLADRDPAAEKKCTARSRRALARTATTQASHTVAGA